MRRDRGFEVEPFTGNRQMVAATLEVNRRTHTIHLVTEADVTEPRRLLEEHRARTGERLSLTAYVVTCLAQTLDEFPRFNAFRRGRRLIVLDDLTISVLLEREIAGERVPEPVAIHEANRKGFREVHREIRDAQRRGGEALGSISSVAWIRLIPAFLLRSFVRWASRNIGMQKRFGVVSVTAVGMFGSGPVWLLPLTSATITVAVGGIARRPRLAGESWEEREHLCVTVSFNHDLIDGAPAARFTARFTELLMSGESLRGEVDGAALKRDAAT